MKNWLALKLLYCGNAHPADRMIGAPCGCVFIIKGYDKLVEQGRYDAQAESFWYCSPDDPSRAVVPPDGVSWADFSRAISRPAVVALQLFCSRVDTCAASTYHYAPVQDGEGIRWQ